MWIQMHDCHLLEQLSQNERKILEKFSASLEDVGREECTSKCYLVRWLRARNWDAVQSEQMLRAHIRWRIANQVDTILSRYQIPEVIATYFPGGVCGEDKTGRPLFIMPAGNFDPVGFMKAVTKQEFTESRVYLLEHLLNVVLTQQSIAQNRCVDQVVLILDMQGLSWRHLYPPWLSTFTEMLHTLDANYPELMSATYVVNAPPLFHYAFNICKPFLHEVTLAKIQLLGTDFREVFQQIFNPHKLPAYYGGTLTDANGDPKCSLQISWAGTVPESFYRQSNQNSPFVKSLSAFSLRRSSTELFKSATSLCEPEANSQFADVA